MPVKFKPILPTDISLKPFLEEPSKALIVWNNAVFKDFQSNVKHFKGKPDFKRIFLKVTRNKLKSSVLTTTNFYKFVVRGTKPHLIKPKRASKLRFKSKYKRKTSPNRIKGMAGGSSGKIVFSKAVRHPGSKAANTDIRIAKKQTPRLIKNMTVAFRKAAKESGHSIGRKR